MRSVKMFEKWSAFIRAGACVQIKFTHAALLNVFTTQKKESKKPLGSYSYGPFPRIKRGKGPIETTIFTTSTLQVTTINFFMATPSISIFIYHFQLFPNLTGF